MIRLLVALLLAGSTVAAQSQTRDTRTWYQAYRDAQTKIQQGNWQGALNDLDAATRAGAPRPARNVNFYGDTYDTYNPDYYRGVALTNLQRFVEADQAFERVRQASLIRPGERLYVEFDQQAQSVKDNVQKLAAAATQPAPNSPPAGAAPSQAQASQGPAQTAAVSSPTAPASGGAATNTPVQGAPSTNAAPSPVGSTPPPVTQPATARVPTPTPTPEQFKAAAGLRVPPPATQNKVSPAATTRPSKPSPTDERDGIVAFYSGEYAAAEQRLRGLADAGIASPRTYLYLACSQAALVLTGRSQPSALADARSLLVRVGDTAPYSRDLALISPRIRQQLGLQP